jgi:uncharacterized integral membrane protein
MLRALFLLPFLLVLVAFALSNQQPVKLALWPTDLSIEAPLSIAVLIASGLFFFLGALFVWWGSLAARARARRAERRAAALEAELTAREKAAVPAFRAPPVLPSAARPALASPAGSKVLVAPR